MAQSHLTAESVPWIPSLEASDEALVSIKDNTEALVSIKDTTDHQELLAEGGTQSNGQGQTRDLQDGHTRDCRKCPGQGLNILIPACTDEKEKVMAPHSSAPAWKIPWTEEPGGLRSLGSLRVGHD